MNQKTADPIQYIFTKKADDCASILISVQSHDAEYIISEFWMTRDQFTKFKKDGDTHFGELKREIRRGGEQYALLCRLTAIISAIGDPLSSELLRLFEEEDAVAIADMMSELLHLG